MVWTERERNRTQKHISHALLRDRRQEDDVSLLLHCLLYFPRKKLKNVETHRSRGRVFFVLFLFFSNLNFYS